MQARRDRRCIEDWGVRVKALAIFGRSREPVIYEVRLEIDPAIISDFDDWLLDHAREMLAFPGFQSADIYRAPDVTENHRAVRVVVYNVRSRRELDSYLRSHATRMREEGVKRFGKQFTPSRRILAPAEHTLPAGFAVLHDNHAISGGLPVCGNCHRPVAGRFCANCGQEDRTYLLSLKELVGEFLGELTNFDSRFFRSIRPLLFRPGWLTLEYVRGRRQQYFPPIRMYIIISLAFFFFTAILADDGLRNANFGDTVSEDGTQEESSPEERRRAIRELEEQLENAEGFERQALRTALAALRAQDEVPQDASTSPQSESERTEVAGDESAAKPESEPDNEKPDEFTVLDFGVPQLKVSKGKATATGWGSEDLNERMARGAEAMQENPRAFVKAMIDNIPSMMFIFLPLIALVLKMLYVFSRRYYVEHLMFSLHFHSAVFVLLLLWMLFRELATLWEPLQAFTGWITAAVWIYIPVYLYKSMRRVYGQGRIMTGLKFFALFFAYIFAATVTSVLLVIAAVYQQA